jgi:hypothetical protein
VFVKNAGCFYLVRMTLATIYSDREDNGSQ